MPDWQPLDFRDLLSPLIPFKVQKNSKCHFEKDVYVENKQHQVLCYNSHLNTLYMDNFFYWICKWTHTSPDRYLYRGMSRLIEWASQHINRHYSKFNLPQVHTSPDTLSGPPKCIYLKEVQLYGCGGLPGGQSKLYYFLTYFMHQCLTIQRF